MNKKKISEIAFLEFFDEYELILKEGNVNKNIYVVNEGIVKIQKTINSKDITIKLVGKGSILGESALFEKDNISFYSAVAIDNSKILKFDKKNFKEILINDHVISFESLRQFGYNYKDLFSSFSDLLLKGEIAFMVNNFLQYRKLKETSEQNINSILVSKEFLSQLTSSKKVELDKNIDTLIEINVIIKTDDGYLISETNVLDKCLAILEMKRKRTTK